MASKKTTAEREAPASQGPDRQHLAVITRSAAIAETFEIHSQADSVEAQQILSAVKTALAAHTERRLGITRKLDQVKRDIMELFRPAQSKAEEVIQTLNRKIIDYDTKIRNEAAEQQRKLDAEIEAKRQADIKLAEKALARGDERKADAFAQRAETRVAPVVPVQSAPAPGRSFVEVWSYVVIDASKLKREYLMPDEKKIGAIVRSLHADAEATVGTGSIRVTNARTVRG